jgi:2-oxoglutarate ferredoxin oxidoreductase subunit alpha
MKKSDLTIAIVGSGGEGVVSAGEIMVRATSTDGLYSMMIKNYGPQIRGGESLAQVRLGTTPVMSQGNLLDGALILSWNNYHRFSGEILLPEGGTVFHDAADAPPATVKFPEGVKFVSVPFDKTAQSTAGTSLAKNIVALGFLTGWYSLPTSGFRSSIKERFHKKGAKAQEGNLKAFEAGMELALAEKDRPTRTWDAKDMRPKLIMSGNEAVSLGAIFAGVQFFAGYPITPASEIMEWMSVELPKFDGVFIQTEDEIAALTMAIGASFAGSKSMTSTSGPGLSLMTEGIGLATMAELPLVVVNVQRAGPSTGIPTKTTQSDLFHSVYGGHGNMPRVVLAAMDIADAVEMAVYAFYFAEKYQTPVILLTDQFLGQRLEVVPRLDFESLRTKVVRRALPTDDDLTAYQRFKLTESGISPVAVPGVKKGMYTAAGIEHNEKGNPTSNAQLEEKMTAKRSRKMQTLLEAEDDLIWEYGDPDATFAILAWGSTKGVAVEAVDALIAEGKPAKAIIPRLLAPLPVEALQAKLDRLESAFIVEMSEGQFHSYLRANLTLPAETTAYKKVGATPFNLQEILNRLEGVLAS